MTTWKVLGSWKMLVTGIPLLTVLVVICYKKKNSLFEYLKLHDLSKEISCDKSMLRCSHAFCMW